MLKFPTPQIKYTTQNQSAINISINIITFQMHKIIEIEFQDSKSKYEIK